jgi:antitoxin component of MazEF toxin-antitoxin module
VQAKIERIGDGFGLILPKELLDACGIGEQATVIVQNRTLIVAAQDWHARQGWNEALKQAAASSADEGEDEETLAHWAGLPEVKGSVESRSANTPEEVLREEPRPYENHQGQGGA